MAAPDTGSETAKQEESKVNRRLMEATSTAARVLKLQTGSHAAATDGQCHTKAAKRSMEFRKETKKSAEADIQAMAARASTLNYTFNYEVRYEKWKAALYADEKHRAYDQQETILTLVHKRCEKEHKIENAGENTEKLQADELAPLFRSLIHI